MFILKYLACAGRAVQYIQERKRMDGWMDGVVVAVESEHSIQILLKAAYANCTEKPGSSVVVVV